MGQGQSHNLFEAAASDELERARYFIEHDHTDVNSTDKDGWTPLHFAAYGGSVDVARELLKLGARPRTADKGGRTPLHLAALQGHMQLVKLLENSGANVNAADEHGMTPLHKAAVQGHAETVAELLAHGAHIDAKLTDGSTALHLAAWKNKMDVVKILINTGANYRAVKNDGQTALHEAAEAGQKESVEYLLSMGANTQAQDEDGATPAVLASKAGHREIAKLIAAGGSAAGRHALPTQAPARKHEDSTLYTYDQLRGGYQAPAGAKPTAPPMPSAPGVPDYSANKAGGAAPKTGTDKEFWNRALQTPIHDKHAASGGGVQYPELYRGGAGASAVQTSHGGSDWWQSRLGKDLSSDFPTKPRPESMPDQAKQGRPNPRKEFEENVLKNAQGLWRMVQGKPKDEREEQAQRAERERREKLKIDDEWASGANTEWAGRAQGVPRVEKYDIKPYEPEDDDEYRTDAEKTELQPKTGGAVSGGATAQVRRRLAELELDMDRQQGWVRGGTKSEAKNVQAGKERMQAQEAEISALRRQLESMQVAASRAHAGGGGRRQYDGSVPAEYICPITQEVMEEPVLAADGFSYERSAILQWLQLGHTTSPMTNQPLEHPGLTPNRALRAAIQQWKST